MIEKIFLPFWMIVMHVEASGHGSFLGGLRKGFVAEPLGVGVGIGLLVVVVAVVVLIVRSRGNESGSVPLDEQIERGPELPIVSHHIDITKDEELAVKRPDEDAADELERFLKKE